MNIQNISRHDIELLARLTALDYPELSLEKIAGKHDKLAHDQVGEKLKSIADAINEKYSEMFGPLHSVKSTGNAIGLGGKLGRTWSGVFKGNSNKQYAAQITLGIDPLAQSVYFGFFFGLAYSKNAEPARRKMLEDGLSRLGVIMYDAITSDFYVRELLNNLLEIGFKCYIKGHQVSLDKWIANLRIDPKFSSINTFLQADKDDAIDSEQLKYYISVCIPLMSIFPEDFNKSSRRKAFFPRPRTPEERAKEAQLKTIIGIKGEDFALDYERKKLARLKLVGRGYPKHVAAISDIFHYDIESIDQYGKVYIEVKTTARHPSDPMAETAYMSMAEYDFFQSKKNAYRLYRVYDIYGAPQLKEIDLNKVTFSADNYRLLINQR